MGNNTGRKVLAYVVGGLGIIFYLAAFVVQEETLVEWWKPALVCLGVAALTGAVMWRWWTRLTGSSGFLFNYICHVAFATGLFLAGFYVLNRVFVDHSTEHEEKAVVTRHYSRERHKTRRSGRRYVSTGETYKVYYIEVGFASGMTKEIEVPAARFHRFHTGDSLRFELGKGLFGIPVVSDRFADKKLSHLGGE